MEKKTVVKVKKQDMMSCFTCPLCNNLYDRATTISECLHIFCRRCIEDKFIVENLKACPVCNVDLGVAPLDKLRADNTWDDLRLSVFKPKPENVKTATETASNSLKYSRKKKKHVPSLIDSSSRVSTSPNPAPDAAMETKNLGEKMEAVSLNQSSSTLVSNFRRRPRKNATPRKNEPQLKPQQLHTESENGFKILLNIEQDNGLAGTLTYKGGIRKENNSEKDTEEIPVSSDDIGKSLITDKEAVPLKSNGKENQDYVASSGGDTEEVSGEKSKECAKETQNTVLNRYDGDAEEAPGEANIKHVLFRSDSDTEEVSGEKTKNNGVEKQENVSTTSGKISGKKGKRKAYYPPVLRPRQMNMNSPCTSSQAVISMEAEKKVEGSNKQVWLSLIAVGNQYTDRPLLPQISHQYIRTNGNLPVSYVKKYLANKLGLESEDEVEIWLRQGPVCSTQKLHNLVDWWVQTTPMAERKSSMVGSSGAEFVMVLHYSGSRRYE